jgi:hypothetical protein
MMKNNIKVIRQSEEEVEDDVHTIFTCVIVLVSLLLDSYSGNNLLFQLRREKLGHFCKP